MAVAYVQPTDPENNVLSNVGGMVGDALQVARGQHELHVGLHHARVLHHPSRQVLKQLVAVAVHHVVAFRTRFASTVLRKISAPKLLLTIARTPSALRA